jgi:hypothetical protein
MLETNGRINVAVNDTRVDSDVETKQVNETVAGHGGEP